MIPDPIAGINYADIKQNGRAVKENSIKTKEKESKTEKFIEFE